MSKKLLVGAALLAGLALTGCEPTATVTPETATVTPEQKVAPAPKPAPVTDYGARASGHCRTADDKNLTNDEWFAEEGYFRKHYGDTYYDATKTATGEYVCGSKGAEIRAARAAEEALERERAACGERENATNGYWYWDYQTETCKFVKTRAPAEPAPGGGGGGTTYVPVPGGDDDGESRFCRRRWWC